MAEKTEKNRHPGQFKPGQSGNPNGRPKGAGISIVTELKRKLKEIPKGEKKTYLKILTQRILDKAIVEGDTTMMKDLIDRVDGKALQGINMSFEDGEEDRKSLKDIVDELKGNKEK